MMATNNQNQLAQAWWDLSSMGNERVGVVFEVPVFTLENSPPPNNLPATPTGNGILLTMGPITMPGQVAGAQPQLMRFPSVNGRKYEAVLLVRRSGGETIRPCLAAHNLLRPPGSPFGIYYHMASTIKSIEWQEIQIETHEDGNGRSIHSFDTVPIKRTCAQCGFLSGHVLREIHGPAPCNNRGCTLSRWYHDYHKTSGQHYRLFQQLKSFKRGTHRLLIIFQQDVGVDVSARSQTGLALNKLRSTFDRVTLHYNGQAFTRFIYLPLDFHRGTFQAFDLHNIESFYGQHITLLGTRRCNNINITVNFAATRI